MKIVILDGYTENPGDLSWEGLAALGELTVHDYTPDDPTEVARRIGDAEAVYTSKVPVSRWMMEQCPNLTYIGALATGYNMVDIQAAKERGITVTNVPGYSTPAVAQMTLALLMEVTCHVGHHNRAVKEGRWCSCRDFCFWDKPIVELAGKTMGIIGFGSIGRAVGRLARALGMNVLAAGSRPCPEGEAIAAYVTLDELLAQADVISLHAPLFPSTHHIVNAENIAKMKDGVILLNTARGPLVDEQALADALNSGKVAAAGLDVVEHEPMLPDNPLLTAQNCVITPHIAWASVEARRRLMDIVVENLQLFQAGTPQNVVNG
ncbi:MAG: D-2-hydroxyacid dehydrogenase [Clostridiales bacterium]|nr:D-2-hydroxyacid dehydrogenase [Clostridiales bacterium]